MKNTYTKRYYILLLRPFAPTMDPANSNSAASGLGPRPVLNHRSVTLQSPPLFCSRWLGPRRIFYLKTLRVQVSRTAKLSCCWLLFPVFPFIASPLSPLFSKLPYVSDDEAITNWAYSLDVSEQHGPSFPNLDWDFFYRVVHISDYLRSLRFIFSSFWAEYFPQNLSLL